MTVPRTFPGCGESAPFSGCEASTKRGWHLLIGALISSVVLMAGCAYRPTVAHDNPAPRIERAENLNQAVAITPETVIIDARSSFEYSMAHVPRSHSLNWADFSEPEASSRGILQKDLFAVARRLARLGIKPDSSVVVVGEGLKGQGEEGRIAWMLALLGVRNVQFLAIGSLRANLTNTASLPPKAAPIWKPEPLESLNVTKAELLAVIEKRGFVTPLAYQPGQPPVLYRIIDVRSEAEYLGREGVARVKKVPNMGAINIPWRQFFTKDLRPDQGIVEKLKAVGIETSHRVIVVGNDGVSSAAVTMALRAFGYSQAGNYAGGLIELLGLREGVLGGSVDR